MVKINLSNTQKTYLERMHYTAIYNSFPLYKKKKLDSIVESTFNNRYEIKDFLIGSKLKMLNILNDYNALSDIDKNDFLNVFNPYFLNQYKTRLSVKNTNDMSYKYNSKKYNAYTLCKKLDLSVCPYCNRQYTITVSNEERDIYTRPALDHFLDKATYPFFALSLYNLVPSCHICNSHIKGSIPFTFDGHINPYFESLHEYKEIAVDESLLSLVDKHSEFNIIFKDKKGVSLENITKSENQIRDLGLDVLYNGHKDKVLELVDLSRAYNSESFQNIYKTFSSSTKIFKTVDEVKSLFLSHHIKDEDIDKRPLNKLVQDIGKELDLI